MEKSGYSYLCSAGETFDSIALAVYEDESRAAELLCMNPEYGDTAEFSGGEALLLPVVETLDDETSAAQIAPWKA